MNIVVLQGNLVRDPESRTVKISGKDVSVCNFSIAVNRKYTKADGDKEQETTFVDCETWDRGAELVQRYLRKGEAVLVQGSLKLDQWETDGVKRSKLKVRVQEFRMLTPKDAGSDSSTTVVPETTKSKLTETDPGATGADPDIPF